jgi:hypothetical protein
MSQQPHGLASLVASFIVWLVSQGAIVCSDGRVERPGSIVGGGAAPPDDGT